MTPFDYLKSNKKRRIKELFEFLSFPSISANSDHKNDVASCAKWLMEHLKSIGFSARLEPTKGHPIVYAEYNVSKTASTVLYYGHYDVQPPEPYDLWKSPPFEPEIRDGYIYARGATDDKGQTFTHIKGLEAVLKATGRLPVNVKLLIEGEEEVASVHLSAYMRKQRKQLKADICVISDTAQFSKTMPAVTFGLRGIAATEVWVYGPNRDLHSGSFGGAVANPVSVLCAMIAKLHDKDNRVAIPGFYNGVRPITEQEKKRFKKLPFKVSDYLRKTGSPALHGEKGYTTFERTWSRPTLEVNGITGGYQGEGSKTIIPSYASAKITMRLVDTMDPDDVMNRLEKFLHKIAPKSVRVKVVKYGGAPGVVVPSDGPWLEAAARAIKTGFGKEPIYMKEGGSIPVVADFKSILGLDTLLIGFGQNDDNIHSPNERFRVRDFERGCITAAALPSELAKV